MALQLIKREGERAALGRANFYLSLWTSSFMDAQILASGNLARIIHATSLASFAALGVQVWEYLICLEKEVDYVWGGRFSTKLLYFATRYIPLIAQVIHIVVLTLFDGASHICNSRIAVKVGLCQAMLTCVEIIQLARLHALFNRSRTTGKLLLGIFITSATMEWAGSGMAIQNILLSSTIGPRYSSRALIVLPIVGTGLCQLTVLSLTGLKFMLVRRGHGRTPLASAMAKEFSVFVLLLVIILAMVAYEIVRSFGVIFWDAAYSWYLAIMSIIGCRLLLGMREIALLPFHRNEEMTGDVDLDAMQCPTYSSP